MATKLLFRDDPYRIEFEGTVVRVEGRSVVLDKTCFYPRGGGQVGDTGLIGGIQVVDTRWDETRITVTHVLERVPSFEVGATVHCQINWDRRYRIMKLHSAAHLVYYLMQDVYGAECKPASSGLVDEKKDRSDYLFTEKLDRDKLKEVEKRANEIIGKGYKVIVWNDGGVNRYYWKIEPFPAMACGGTHVKNVREIGKIVVKRGRKPGLGKERVEILLA